MYTITINGSTLEELFSNIERIAAVNKGTAPTVNSTQPITGASVQNPYEATPQASAALPNAPAAPPVPAAAATNAMPAPTFPAASSPAPAIPTAAPTYTLEALARAGAALAQAGKMDEALALLARYGVQTVNQLKPEQYGSFATELRALGAQV